MPYFIGKTALIERTLAYKSRTITTRLLARQPIPVRERRWLLHGPAGTGKTELGWLIAGLLVGRAPQPHVATAADFGPPSPPRSGRGAGGEVSLPRPDTFRISDLNIEHLNGAGLSVEVVRKWTEENQYRALAGQVAVKFVDEIDGISTAALTDIRTYLDELPAHRVFIATTNRTVDGLQEQLQSRFQPFEFAPVDSTSLAAHLQSLFPGLPAARCASIAQDCAGNVRAAELDAQTRLDVLNMLAEAA